MTKYFNILEKLYQYNMILIDVHKGWKLQSGIQSPIYIQLRRLISYPDLLKDISSVFNEHLNLLIKEKKLSREALQILGVAMVGVPIATAFSLESKIPALMTRKFETASDDELSNAENLIQRYGQHKLIEGSLKAFSQIILIDDVIQSFKSKETALKILKHTMQKEFQEFSYSVPYLFIIIDRQETNLEFVKSEYNIEVFSLFKMGDDILPYLKTKLSKDEFIILENYFKIYKR